MRPAPIVFRAPLLSLNVRLVSWPSEEQFAWAKAKFAEVGVHNPTLDDYISIFGRHGWDLNESLPFYLDQDTKEGNER